MEEARRRLRRTLHHMILRPGAVAASAAPIPAQDRKGPIPPPRDPESAFTGGPWMSEKPGYRTAEEKKQEDYFRERLRAKLLDPIPTTRDLDPPGADKLGLTPEEVASFREKGYIIKRGLIPEADLKPFQDFWWEQPPVVEAFVKKEDPGSWIAPGKHWPTPENRWGLDKNWMGKHNWPGLDQEERPFAALGERVGRLPHKLTHDISNDVWRWHGIGHDPGFVNATSNHPNTLYMIEALLGGPVKRPVRNRGVYSVFPLASGGPKAKLGPHHDGLPTEIIGVTLLEEVKPRSGGFTIWPGSAQKLYSTSQQALNWVPTEESNRVFAEVKESVQPVEFVGGPGDVILIHGWTVHSAGLQESTRVRKAVIQDFSKARERGHIRWTAAGKNGGKRVNCDMDGVFRFPTTVDDDGGLKDDPADGNREVTVQWIIDGPEFVADRRPPFPDVFEEWNLGKNPVVGNVVDEPPWWEKYDLPMLPSQTEGGAPRGGGGCPAVPLSQIATYEGNGVWRARNRGNDWMKKNDPRP